VAQSDNVFKRRVDDVESAWSGHKTAVERWVTSGILANGHHIESGLGDSVESAHEKYRRHQTNASEMSRQGSHCSGVDIVVARLSALHS
jgi:hypothetical protein